jgi:ElaB/YqjD/DUF883 family membrane-anchored ribosome-binding protein
MKTKDEFKQDVEDAAETVQDGIDVAAAKLASSAEALRAQANDLEDQLRDAGRRLLEGAKELGNTASTQTKLHPLAAVGIAFAAGVILARALRR